MKACLGLLLTMCGVMAAPQVSDTPEAVTVQTATYRLVLPRDKALVRLSVPSAAGLQPVTRPGGEDAWYGYNDPTGEVRSSASRPTIAIDRRAEHVTVTVTCAVGPLTHRADYLCRDDMVVVRSLLSGEVPANANLMRVAPRFDLDLARFGEYAFADQSEKSHTGRFPATRPWYLGTGAWGSGDTAGNLSEREPFWMVHQGGRGLAVVYPYRRELWVGVSHFIQQWTGGANYAYSGLADAGVVGRDVVFAWVPVADGGPAALRAGLPRVLAAVQSLIETRALPVERLARLSAVRRRLDSLAKELASPATDPAQRLRRWRLRVAWQAAHRCLDRGEGLAAEAVLGE